MGERITSLDEAAKVIARGIAHLESEIERRESANRVLVQQMDEVQRINDRLSAENASLERDIAELRGELAEALASSCEDERAENAAAQSAPRDLAELMEAARGLHEDVEVVRRLVASKRAQMPFDTLHCLGVRADALAALLPAEPPKEASDGK